MKVFRLFLFLFAQRFNLLCMYNLEHFYSIEEHPEFKSRVVMNIPAIYLETFFHYKIILKINHA